MTIDQTPPEEFSDDLLSAEYALGLLAGEELAQARQHAATDRAFVQQVTGWEIRLATLTDELRPQTPDPETKKTLLAQLFPAPAPVRWWEKLRIWQGISALSVLALAVLFMSDVATGPEPTGPLYTAEIKAEAGDFRVVAVVDKSTNEVIMTKTAGAAPDGRILQVWAHGEDAPAISVGLWPEGDTVRLAMPAVIAAVEGTLTLGVSEEPPGGSVTGSPSGRVFGTVDIPGVNSPSDS